MLAQLGARVSGVDLDPRLIVAARLNARRHGHSAIDFTEVPSDGPIYDELTRDGRALLIAPHWRRGLLPADLDAIEAFL